MRLVKSTSARRHAAAATTGRDAAAINTAWFNRKLADAQITQRKLADKLTLDPAAVSLLLRGKRRMQLDEAAAMAELFGAPLADVLAAAGIDTNAGAKDTVPVVGWVDDAGQVHMQRPNGPQGVAAPIGVPKAALALRYQTKGPTDGWTAFYVPAVGVSPEVLGQVCVVQLAGKGGTFIRAVKRGYARGTYNLVGLQIDQAPIDGVQLVAAAPVLWLKTG